MAEKKFDAQVNYGWGLTLNMTGKAPAVAKRIFPTYKDALDYINDYNDSAIEGLTLSVVNDTDELNGSYFVEKVGTLGDNNTYNNDGVLRKLVNSKDLNDIEQELDSFTIKKGSGTNSSLQVNAPGSDASGTNSFAAGMDAVASGDYSIAVGRSCSAIGRGSVALGGIVVTIKLTGEQNAVTYQINSMYVKLAKSLIGCKLVDLSDLITPIATIISTNVVNNTAFITVDKTLSESALSSKSYGLLGCNASGTGSVALAGCIKASGYNSIAEGLLTVAEGDYSHAEGHYNVSSGYASHSEGYDTEATAISSHAEGAYNLASGTASHAEGAYSLASGDSSHTEGAYNLASGTASHAEGYGTIASGNSSHVEGSGIYNIYLTGNNSTYQISRGSNTLNTFHFIKRCQGASIVEFTNYTKIAVINSIDISEDGYTVTVVTDIDLGELSNYKCGVVINIASGQASHTENGALASGKESHAGGWSLATNNCSFSHGYDCVADGEVSTSFGINNYSQNQGEFTLGISNHSHTGETLAELTLFSIGCGDWEEIDMSKRIEQQLPLPTPEDGTNALEVMRNGDIWLGGYEEGVKLFEGETKELNTYIKSEVDNKLSNIKEIDVVDNLDDTNPQAALSANQGRILNETKAPLEGYAPNLKVRFSDGLVGRIETIPREIGRISPTAGISVDDDSAMIERIKGESVVWNQLLLENNFKCVDATCEEDGDYYKVIPEDSYSNRFQQPRNIIENHIYLQTAIVYNTSNVDIRFTNYLGLTMTDSSSHTNKSEPTLIWSIKKATQTITSYIQIANLSTLDPYWIKKNSFLLYDLTLMFGAGNEPTTIEEFEARKPLGVTDEYNEGEIISYEGGDNSLKSIGFNAYNGEYAKVIGGKVYELLGEYTNIGFTTEEGGELTTIEIPNDKVYTPTENGYIYAQGTNICIHLAHSGYRNGEYQPYEEDTLALPNVKDILDADGNQLFPYGLLSAGSVHDEITATKAIKRIGVVDMGELTWTYRSELTYPIIQTDSLKGLIKENEFPNILCKRYITYPNTIVNLGSIKDANICIYKVYNPTGIYNYLIGVYDDFYTNANTFKQAMQGVLLYYELAEPIEVDLEEPLNMSYKAWDFGTEELVVSEPSTSLKGEIIYHFNAVDRIRDNGRNIDTLELKVEELDVELDSKIESEPISTSITNIEESLVSSALRKTPLTLTESEKEQARTNIEALKELTLTVKDNGNIVISNIQGLTKEFMPATPSGDPMHYAYETAGAVYNGTDNFIIKDTPWKDMVDTIEDKAKWGFDVVDASQVKQMTIGGTTYNYVQTTRQSPEGTTEPRYFLVGQASDGTWVEDETKVLHLPGHWYLNGLGDITGIEIALCYTQTMPYYTTNVLTKAFRLQKSLDRKTLKYRTTFRNTRQYSTLGSTVECESMFYGNPYMEIFIITFYVTRTTTQVNGLSNAFYNAINMKYLIGQLTSATRVDTDQSMKVLSIVLKHTANLTKSSYISKPSILYVINNAAPTTPITITLHADRYAQLSEDADIVAALEAKNTALEGTGGSVSLVSA